MELDKAYGLNRPLGEQYLRFMGRLTRGDLGISIAMDGQSVGSLIAQTLPVSLGLGLFALLIAVGFGIPLGFWWAAQGKINTHPLPLPQGGNNLEGASAPSPPHGNKILSGQWLYIFTLLPSFVAAPLAQQLVLRCGGVAYGYTGIQSLFWPSLVLGLYYLPFVARLSQVGFQSEEKLLYLRVAEAKGLSRFGALWKHGARAALSPVLAYLGPTAAGLVTGSFVVETVWGLPGLGRFFVNAVFNRDDPLLLGLVAFYAVALIFFNTVVEIFLKQWNPSVNGRSGR